jgi:4-amino-4-deoxy-L-arabinose transferase-like glycosyltransferase
VGAALVRRAAALLTLLFLVSTPVILGHAAVVALDVPVTAMTMLALYLLLRWFESPGVASGLRFGLAAGLAVATKMSAVPFIGVALLALVALAIDVGCAARRWHGWRLGVSAARHWRCCWPPW